MNETPPPIPELDPPPVPAKYARAGLWLGVVTILLCVWFVLSQGGKIRHEKSEAVEPNPLTNLMARYLIGSKELLLGTPAWNSQSAQGLSSSLKDQARSPADQFRAELVCAVLEDRRPSEILLREIAEREPMLRKDSEFVASLSTPGTQANASDWQWFKARHGWVARLAEAQANEWPQPEWDKLKSEAKTTMITFGGASLFGFAAFIGGIVLLVLLISRWRKGYIRTTLQGPPPAQAHAFIEAFAIYIFGYTVAITLLRWLFPALSSMIFYGAALSFVAVGILWPRWRGVSHGTWTETMGWHRGHGVLREMGIGLLGWVAGLPLLLAAASLAPLISRWTGADPTHPMVQEITQPGMGRWGIIALAVIWAPLVEETMFRGLLFPAISAGKRWLLGSLLSAFIFAVIHPQGWAGVPAIMAIALTLSTLRLLRGSLIAPMTAHALNNGMVCALLLFSL
jgi:membrane protease YdiL (CAAX protease family)